MPHDLPDDGIPRAKQITVSVCAHGTVTYELLDVSGKVFARAHLPRENFFKMVDKVCLDLEAFKLAAVVARLQ